MIKVEKETREAMIVALTNYYLNEREEEIGHLASSMLLDFIIEKLAPEFYNQGIMDATKYINDRVEDMQVLLK
jgi:uncharacterized protein (DUF2164 family)